MPFNTTRFVAKKTFNVSLSLSISLLLSLNTHSIAIASDDISLATIDIDVKRFVVTGKNPLSASETTRILDKYVGEHQGVEGIEAAADALQAALKQAGFPFYRVRVPTQSLQTGTIQLEMVTLPIGNIEVRGNKHFSEQNIRHSIPKLQQDADTSDMAAIYRGLDLANQHRTKRARLTFNTDDEQEQVNATIEVKDYNPLELTLFASNTGDDNTGEYRTGVTLAHHNLFDRDHGLSMSYVVSPDNASDVKQYDVNYRLPLYPLGDEINVMLWRSDSSSSADLNGAGEIDSIRYTHFFDKSKDYQHQLDVSLQDKFFNNDITPNDPNSNNDVRSRPLEVGYKGRFSTKNTDTDFSLAYRKNLSGGDKNDKRSYELARIGAVQNWSAVTAGMHVNYFLPQQWVVHASVDGQLTNNALISGEQFGVGGSNSLAGFEEREVVGDRGYQTKLELKTPRLYKNLQLFAHYEAANVKREATLVGQATSETVSSIGVGVTTPIGKRCGAKLQAGYVLDGVDDVFEGDSRTRDGDSKAHVNLLCNLL